MGSRCFGPEPVEVKPTAAAEDVKVFSMKNGAEKNDFADINKQMFTIII